MFFKDFQKVRKADLKIHTKTYKYTKPSEWRNILKNEKLLNLFKHWFAANGTNLDFKTMKEVFERYTFEEEDCFIRIRKMDIKNKDETAELWTFGLFLNERFDIWVYELKHDKYELIMKYEEEEKNPMREDMESALNTRAYKKYIEDELIF